MAVLDGLLMPRQCIFIYTLYKLPLREVRRGVAEGHMT